MEHTAPRRRRPDPDESTDPDSRLWWRILAVAGFVLVVLVVVAAFVYAGAFIMLAPIMQ